MAWNGMDRRRFLTLAAGGASALVVTPWTTLLAAEAPKDCPVPQPRDRWLDDIRWDNVLSIEAIKGDDTDTRAAAGIATLAAQGGGVLYFPPGVYQFKQSIQLATGVVLRGADPKVVARATEERYDPPTRFEFPRFKFSADGDGMPIDTAFKGIYLADPSQGANTGVVNVDINRGHIHLGEGDEHTCGGHRIVYGCALRNAAAADARVPDVKAGQHPWQRFTHRHHAAIDVHGHNLLIANNRLPRSGDDNFVMKGFKLKPARGNDPVYDVTFDYDNRPGLYINHHCVGGAGGSGNDGTPESHPFGFRKGIVIRDNYVYNSGRMCIGFTGDGVLCKGNVTRIPKDVWRPTNTGIHMTFGSSTNDNRAIEMRGWRWQVIDNDCVVHRNWAAQRGYLINDGEGLMHEDHCNSDLRESVLKGNRVNSYLSIYKCGPIDGLLIEDNDVSVPGGIADIYVVANRNAGPQPCHNVTIVNNTTHRNGIHIAGSPAKNNVIKANRHKGTGGKITNEAKAKVVGNQGYAMA